MVRRVLFGGNNVNKAVEEDKDLGRMSVAGAQAVAALSDGAKMENGVGKSLASVFDSIKYVSRTTSSPLMKYASDAITNSAKWVNPLIVVSEGVRVALDDNKPAAAVEAAPMLGSMFLCEYWMKKGFDSKAFNKFRDSIKNPKAKIAFAIGEGVAFVLGSIAGSTLGKELGISMSGRYEKSMFASKRRLALNAKHNFT